MERAGPSESAGGPVDAATFRKLCLLVYEQAGIRLRPGKEALVGARVAKRLRALGLASVREYLKFLTEDTTGQELIHFVDVITTNYTRFFREPEHFELLSRFVHAHWALGRHRLRVWCAAAATGEEPYSLAIALSKLADTQPLEFRLLATDISTAALSKAKRGRYPEKALEAVIRADRLRYFEADGVVGDDRFVQVRPELRARVVFDRVNLAHPPYPMKGPFDIIFCRNVMIYFDTAVRQELVGEIERLLAPGGLLVIGHAETLTSIKSTLTLVQPSLYRRPELSP